MPHSQILSLQREQILFNETLSCGWMWHDRNEKGFKNQTGLFCATKKMVIFTYYQPHGGLHCISTLVSSNNLNLLPLFHRRWRLLQLWREWPLCPGMSRGRGWETRKRTRGRWWRKGRAGRAGRAGSKRKPRRLLGAGIRILVRGVCLTRHTQSSLHGEMERGHRTG